MDICVNRFQTGKQTAEIGKYFRGVLLAHGFVSLVKSPLWLNFFASPEKRAMFHNTTTHGTPVLRYYHDGFKQQ